MANWSTLVAAVVEMAAKVDVKLGTIFGAVETSGQNAQAALTAKTETLTAFAAIRGRYYGSAAANPATRPDGSPMQPGDEYDNATVGARMVYRNGLWAQVPGITAADLANSTDSTKGAAQVGWDGRSLGARLASEGNRRLTRWFRNGAAGKKIAFVGDSTTMQLFSGGAITTGDPESLPVPARYAGELPNTTWLNFGSNGNTLANFLSVPGASRGLNALIAAAPDLIVFCYGINDTRQGATSGAQLIERLVTAINTILTALPNVEIVLRMPNSFTTDHVGAVPPYVVASGIFEGMTVAQAAQAATDILRNAYRSLIGRWPNVVVYDTQKNVFGETCKPFASVSSMTDQIHPNTIAYRIIIDGIIQGVIGPNAVERMDNGYAVGDFNGFRLAFAKEYNHGSTRDAINSVGYRLAPTVCPQMLFGPDFELVVAGTCNGVTEGAVNLTITEIFGLAGLAEPQLVSGDVRAGDYVLQMADSGPAVCIALHQNGGNKNGTGLNLTNIFHATAAPNKAAVQAGGKPIAIFRNKYANSAAAKNLMRQPQYAASAIWRVVSRGNETILLQGVGWGPKDSQWTPRAGDIVAIGETLVTLTSAMTLSANSSGAGWSINQPGVDFTTTTAELAVIVGQGPVRKEANYAQPLRLDIDGVVASTTINRYLSRNARYTSLVGFLDTPDATNPTVILVRTMQNTSLATVATITFAAGSSTPTIAYNFNSNIPIQAGVRVAFVITSGGPGVAGLHLALEA